MPNGNAKRQCKTAVLNGNAKQHCRRVAGGAISAQLIGQFQPHQQAGGAFAINMSSMNSQFLPYRTLLTHS